MSDVLKFPAGHVQIDGGTVTKSSRYEPGTTVYFVDLVDNQGAALGVWDGTDYGEACRAAREWELPIRDKVKGGLAQ